MTFRIKQKHNLFQYLHVMFSLHGLLRDEIDDCLNKLDAFIKKIDDNTFIGIEYPYVDKLFRDSYYGYYSSKLKLYKKNCVRLSFFSSPISSTDFFDKTKKNELEKSFLGFLILRPTPPNIIGRNFFSPHAFTQKENVYITSTKIIPTINGVKLHIEGFPHCSQDSEMMVCAETTIWSIMEYFSNRYSDYHSILPHDINDILSNKSVERQTPSLGLTGYHMSFVLKKLGFGVRMYSSHTYLLGNLHKLIQMYVESGIPVIAIIRNEFVVHSLNIVGRMKFNKKLGFSFSEVVKLQSGSVLYNFYEQKTTYLVIDDNHSPYSEIDLADPAINYRGYVDWDKCDIDSAIVPLHKEIYMEADRAENLVFRFLYRMDEIFPLPSLVVRVFLSSCRSFKDFISSHSDIPYRFKRKLINIDMPKFVYLAEFALSEEVLEEKANGIMILDATEPKMSHIIGFFLGNIFLNTRTGDFNIDTVPLPPFARFNNLQKF